MEQLLTFVLGATFALGLIGLGYIFISVLKMKKEIKNLNGAEESINRDLNETHQEINKLFNEFNQDVDRRVDEIYSKIDELNRYVDSRFDKQAEKTASTMSLGNSVLYDRVDKLDNLFKLQMDQFAKVTLDHSDRIAELETERKIQEDKIEQINS